MRFVFAPRLLAAIGTGLLLASSAQAVVWQWNFSKGQPGSYGRNDAGGTVESIVSTFNDANKRLTFDVLFSGPNNAGGAPATNGFWLVLNDGPNPKNNPGELAIFYFDASKVFDSDPLDNAVVMTTYEYNGRNDNSSWNNGDGDGTANEAGDFNGLIYGKNESGLYINSISAFTEAGGTRRRMTFDINAAAIVGRSPSYPEAGTTWHGTGFDDQLGIWFHPAQIFSASYQASGRGKINSLSVSGEGWIDGEFFRTVPTPGSAAMLGLGALLVTRRRR